VSDTSVSADKAAGAIQLDSVLDAMVESMIVIDEHGTIERVNKATGDMFGYRADELVGQSVGILMVGADKVRHVNYLHRYKETGVRRIIGIGREVQAQRKDGSNFPAHIAVGEVGAENTRRFVGLIRDLTDQRQNEEEALRRREEMVNVSRLSMMGEMAAAMAHELNQPLTAIANYAAASLRLLEQGTADSLADVKAALQEINDQAHRAGDVIQRTRSFTKSADGTRTVTRIHEVAALIRSLATLDTRANNIQLNWEIPDDLPPIVVDSVQIQQIILNLVRNAVDAMDTTVAEKRQIRVTAKLTAPHEIRLEVSDCGSGVSDACAANIFNAFYTTKSTGMGMGLAICRTIARSHGGQLGFRNNEPKEGGATFFFTLPTQVNS
jgi:two-component system sensor kinase FixL